MVMFRKKIHPRPPLGLNQKHYVFTPPARGEHPHGTCLDCGKEFWSHTWDGLWNDLGWHEPRHIIHIWD